MSDGIPGDDVVVKSTAVGGQVDPLVMQKCLNCAEWQQVNSGSEKGECLERDRFTYPDNTCVSFAPDPSRFCAICGAAAIETDHSGMACTKHDSHGASQWDYEWHDFSA